MDDSVAIADLLRAFLERRGLTNHARLPPERALARELGVSRNRLRTGLAELERQGAIWRHVGKGTFVGPATGTRAEAAVRSTALTSPREIMEARLALEPAHARLAAFRATTEDFERLDTCLANGSAGDIEAFRRWDMKLHLAVSRATGNTLLASLFDHIHSDRTRYFWGQLGKQMLTERRITLYNRHHRAIIEAIRARDPDGAEAAMRTHLEAVREQIFGEF